MTFPAGNIDAAEPTEFGNDIDPAGSDVPDKLKGRTLLYFEVRTLGRPVQTTARFLQGLQAVTCSSLLHMPEIHQPGSGWVDHSTRSGMGCP